MKICIIPQFCHATLNLIQYPLCNNRLYALFTPDDNVNQNIKFILYIILLLLYIKLIIFR